MNSVSDPPQVITQNPHYFSVQIRCTRNNAIVGTGIVVSEKGHILTCAHVVVEAGVNPRLGKAIPSFWNLFFNQSTSLEMQQASAQVKIYFPKTRTSEPKSFMAEVVGFFAEHDDDIVLLQIVSDSLVLEPKQIARLGVSDCYLGHKFQSYGFKKQGDIQSGYATGEIMGPVEVTHDCSLQVNPIELRTHDIDYGMSGAGVLDSNLNLVVGLVIEKSIDNPRVAWAIDSYVLKFEPICLQVLEQVIQLV